MAAIKPTDQDSQNDSVQTDSSLNDQLERLRRENELVKVNEKININNNYLSYYVHLTMTAVALM